MGNIFSPSEIIEIGIQIEKNGKAFYNEVIKNIQSEKLINVFKFLGEQENYHIQVFEKMLDQAEKYDKAESYEGEYMEYLKALAEEHVFTKSDQGNAAAKNIHSELEAVDLAIKFEKDSILFYEEMKKVVPAAGHNVINSIIEQEQDHVRRLSQMKKSF